MLVIQNIPAPEAMPFCWGHEDAKTLFLHSLQARRLAHAWLLVGPPGIGKRTLSYQIIRLLFSGAQDFDNLSQSVPENSPLFQRIAQRTHGDLLVIEPQQGHLSINQVRPISSFLQKTPLEGGWRIVLITGVDTLTTQGSNALLKTLEAPPPRTLLLLTARTRNGVLPTLRSRCRILALSALTAQHMAYALKYFEIPSLDPDIEAWAQGNLGLTLRMTQLRPRLQNVYDFLLNPYPTLPPEVDWECLTWGVPVWFQSLLLRGVIGPTLSPKEQALFQKRSLEMWWHVWDSVKDLLKKGQNLHLDPLHILINIFNIINEK